MRQAGLAGVCGSEQPLWLTHACHVGLGVVVGVGGGVGVGWQGRRRGATNRGSRGKDQRGG